MMQAVIGLVKKSVALVMLAGLVACQAADGTTQAPDTALVGSLMRGLGAVDPNAKSIDYKPRAPLALPAEGGKLPEPVTDVAGTNSADWPKQQESEQLKELKALYAKNGQSDGSALTPEQMRGFKITGVTGAQQRDVIAERRDSEITDGEVLTRAEQQAEWEALQKLKTQESGVKQGTLAARRYLTEPPSAYSTPSPDAPMPEVVAKKKKATPGNNGMNSSPVLDPRCLGGDSDYCR
ncbi:MAG: hypothetical protein ABJN98_10145 [Roseibium sp.]